MVTLKLDAVLVVFYYSNMIAKFEYFLQNRKSIFLFNFFRYLYAQYTKIIFSDNGNLHVFISHILIEQLHNTPNNFLNF